MKIKPVNIHVRSNYLFYKIALYVDRPDFIKKVQDERKHHGIKKPPKRNLNKEDGHGYPDTIRDNIMSCGVDLADRYPSSYFEVILNAFLYGEVYETDILAEAKIIDPGSIVLGEIDLEESDIYDAFISVYPETSEKQLLSVFRKYKLEFKTFEKTISNIKRDRKWYWLNQNDMSYKKIWEYQEKIRKPFSIRAIGMAIEQYKEKLCSGV